MKEIFDFDPQKGIKRYIENVEGQIAVYSEQDCTAVIDRCKQFANEGKRDGGIKNGWFHIADIPDQVWLEIREKYNCDIFTTDEKEFKRFLSIIERDYAYLKTTHKRVA